MPKSDERLNALRETFSAYMTETSTNHPWWGEERLEEAAGLWHDRNGLARGTFALSDLDLPEAAKDPTPAEGDATPAKPRKNKRAAAPRKKTK